MDSYGLFQIPEFIEDKMKTSAMHVFLLLVVVIISGTSEHPKYANYCI